MEAINLPQINHPSIPLPLSLSLSIFSIFEFLTFHQTLHLHYSASLPQLLIYNVFDQDNTRAPDFSSYGCSRIRERAARIRPRKVVSRAEMQRAVSNFTRNDFSSPSSPFPSFSVSLPLRCCDSKEGPRIRRWHYNHRFGRSRGQEGARGGPSRGSFSRR